MSKKKSKSKLWTACLLEEYEYALLKSRELQKDGSVYKAEVQSMVTKKTRSRYGDVLFDTVFESVVIFGQYECGTGICVSKDGKVLSCAHVCGERPRVGCKKVVIFMNGTIAVLELVKVDIRCDVALFSVAAILDDKNSNTDKTPKIRELPSTFSYPYSRIDLSQIPLKKRSVILCIGQPGRDDLESHTPQKTPYDLVCVSKGTIVRVMEGDLNDNSEIGKLVHSAWTYWGHSGAALLSMQGKVIGLHSSWDDDCGTRHGVHRDAIQKFVRGLVSYDSEEDDNEKEESERDTMASSKRRARAILHDVDEGETSRKRRKEGRRYSDAIELS